MSEQEKQVVGICRQNADEYEYRAAEDVWWELFPQHDCPHKDSDDGSDEGRKGQEDGLDMFHQPEIDDKRHDRSKEREVKNGDHGTIVDQQRFVGFQSYACAQQEQTRDSHANEVETDGRVFAPVPPRSNQSAGL